MTKTTIADETIDLSDDEMDLTTEQHQDEQGSIAAPDALTDVFNPEQLQRWRSTQYQLYDTAPTDDEIIDDDEEEEETSAFTNSVTDKYTTRFTSAMNAELKYSCDEFIAQAGIRVHYYQKTTAGQPDFQRGRFRIRPGRNYKDLFEQEHDLALAVHSPEKHSIKFISATPAVLLQFQEQVGAEQQDVRSLVLAGQNTAHFMIVRIHADDSPTKKNLFRCDSTMTESEQIKRIIIDAEQLLDQFCRQKFQAGKESWKYAVWFAAATDDSLLFLQFHANGLVFKDNHALERFMTDFLVFLQRRYRESAHSLCAFNTTATQWEHLIDLIITSRGVRCRWPRQQWSSSVVHIHSRCIRRVHSCLAMRMHSPHYRQRNCGFQCPVTPCIPMPQFVSILFLQQQHQKRIRNVHVIQMQKYKMKQLQHRRNSSAQLCTKMIGLILFCRLTSQLSRACGSCCRRR